MKNTRLSCSLHIQLHINSRHLNMEETVIFASQGHYLLFLAFPAHLLAHHHVRAIHEIKFAEFDAVLHSFKAPLVPQPLAVVSALDSQVSILIIVFLQFPRIFVCILEFSCIELILHLGDSLVPAVDAPQSAFGLNFGFGCIFSLDFKFFMELMLAISIKRVAHGL